MLSNELVERERQFEGEREMLHVMGIDFRGRDIAYLASALGPLACLGPERERNSR